MEWIFTDNRFPFYSCLSASIIFKILSRNVSVPLWLKNSSATMVCPFLCVVMIPSGFRGGAGVLFFSVNRSLLSLGVKKGFPVIGKSLLAVGCLVLLCGCGGLRLFSRSVFPRFDTVILPLLFNVFSAVGSGICCPVHPPLPIVLSCLPLQAQSLNLRMSLFFRLRPSGLPLQSLCTYILSS